MEYPKFEINQEVVVNGTTSTFLVKQINRQFYHDKTWRDTYQLYGYGGKWFEEHELKAALTKEDGAQAALEAIRIMWNNSVADEYIRLCLSNCKGGWLVWHQIDLTSLEKS